VTAVEYNLLDQPVKITYPDHVGGTHERIETFHYDNHGKLVQKSGAGGFPLNYTCDDVGKPSFSGFARSQPTALPLSTRQRGGT
jgi:uncharacterized protein RhaS with RHS repeats